MKILPGDYATSKLYPGLFIVLKVDPKEGALCCQINAGPPGPMPGWESNWDTLVVVFRPPMKMVGDLCIWELP